MAGQSIDDTGTAECSNTPHTEGTVPAPADTQLDGKNAKKSAEKKSLKDKIIILVISLNTYLLLPSV